MSGGLKIACRILAGPVVPDDLELELLPFSGGLHPAHGDEAIASAGAAIIGLPLTGRPPWTETPRLNHKTSPNGNADRLS